jgi:hypothetical protein
MRWLCRGDATINHNQTSSHMTKPLGDIHYRIHEREPFEIVLVVQNCPHERGTHAKCKFKELLLMIGSDCTPPPRVQRKTRPEIVHSQR